MEKLKYLDENDKQVIVSYTLDSIGHGLLRGMLIGLVFGYITRSRTIFALTWGYSTGLGYDRAERFYNEYLRNKIIK
jgi:hypothetical protein